MQFVPRILHRVTATIAALVVVPLLLTGCAIDPICLMRIHTPDQELDRATEAAERIRAGMTRSEVFDVLPPARPAEVREGVAEERARLGYRTGWCVFVVVELVDGAVPAGSWVRLSVRDSAARPRVPMAVAVEVDDGCVERDSR